MERGRGYKSPGRFDVAGAVEMVRRWIKQFAYKLEKKVVSRANVEGTRGVLVFLESDAVIPGGDGDGVDHITMSALPEILNWDEEAPGGEAYDIWERKRLMKRDAAIAILRPGGEVAASNEAETRSETDEEVSARLIGEFWPA